MEYISAEEFLKQPEEVQAVFLNWWEPSVGDLFNFPEIDSQDCREVEYICSVNRLKTISLTRTIPLLTEGQLRKFIEDKTGYKIDLNYYEINVYDLALTEGKTNYFNYLDLGHDLLQAYWKVACEIASSEVKDE